jgi:membrane protein implicated in regulation of membrane protease activity
MRPWIEYNYLTFVGLESRSSRVLLTAAVSSSVVTFLVLTLAAGVACGYYFVRQRHKQSSSSNQSTEPLYDDVNTLPTAVEHAHQEQGLELTENVAYGSAKPMTY